MAHFDADRETIDWYRKNGSRKTSPQDIQYPDEARFVLSPEELEAALRPFDSSEGSQDSEPDSEA
ncbi:hypothetical protein SAMN02745729_10122 [Marinobacterium iners DSM 11526]|uniref:Uncharacterized protein n=2 Tax=Marinobacterium iners TaxID=48076 RepID=A0A1H3X325_9GAMM|nr:hypothetical protein SAMN02745729_10122 [Marinobacterium iners DSM 11526]